MKNPFRVRVGDWQQVKSSAPTGECDLCPATAIWYRHVWVLMVRVREQFCPLHKRRMDQ